MNEIFHLRAFIYRGESYLATSLTLIVFTQDSGLKELEETLRKDFSWDRDQIKHTIEKIKARTILIQPKNKVSVIKENDDDNRILECAIEGTVQYLISGDRKHLLPLKEYQGTKIISPSDFLKLLFL